mgnify:CR=1 FL=1
MRFSYTFSELRLLTLVPNEAYIYLILFRKISSLLGAIVFAQRDDIYTPLRTYLQIQSSVTFVSLHLCFRLFIPSSLTPMLETFHSWQTYICVSGSSLPPLAPAILIQVCC